jgi:SAM-dependent methyltransferase
LASQEQTRQLALALPEVVEQDHHGRPSFRVAGRIFATLWDAGHMNVMLDEPGIRTAVQSNPGVCMEFWWGKKLRAVQLDLALADQALASGLLADAWEQKAPKRLLNNRPAHVSPRVLELARTFRLGADDLADWQLTGLADDAFDDWLTDRVARQPAGRRARETYGAANVHDFARRAILDALALRPGERLLEIGCGGGLLLREAVACGVSATGLDHSQEMVSLAGERAPGAEVVLGSAERLPFPDRSFDAVAMSVVFFFFPDPVAVLRECRRVLTPGGRITVYTTGPSLRGTPAAPEPLASRGYFYENEELATLANEAPFVDVAVRDDGGGGQLLTARA